MSQGWKLPAIAHALLKGYRFMFARYISLRRFRIVVALACVPGVLSFARAAEAQAKPSVLTQKAGKYAVDLRVPQDGLYAEDETDVEFHVSDLSQDDPVQGAPPIVNAKVTARVTMPAMASMPAQSPRIHAEGVPGDYGVVLLFPHGGEYRLDLTITPPADKPFTVSYNVPVGDVQTDRRRKPKPKPYSLEVASNPPTPEA